MHYFYLVKVNAESADEARQEAAQALDMHSFAAEAGYFGNSKADWYVVGGRWSGVLGKTTEAEQEKRDAYKQDGYPDDAQPLTAELIKYLKAESYGDVEIFDADEAQEFTVDDQEEVDEPGTYLVAIDYHN
jgi:hypothetical protein